MIAKIPYVKTLMLLTSLGGMVPVLNGQAPFLRTNQVFLVVQNSHDLAEFTVSGYNTLQITTLGATPAGGIDAIGFRKTDNLLYGINPGNNHLLRLGQSGSMQDLGTAGLDNTLFYLAGDISPDGKYLYTVGSTHAGADVHLAKTDLSNPGFPIQFIPINSGGHLADIAFDPYTNKLFGYDAPSQRVVIINAASGVFNAFPPMESGNSIYGLYFDAFGDLYGYGSTLYGVVDALFRIDKNTGRETRLATGPVTPVVDAAACPYSVAIKSTAEPETTLPCSEVQFNYTIANGSGELLTGIDFEHALPPGFHFAGVVQNPFGVQVDTISVPGSMRLANLTLPTGTRNFSFKVSVGDIDKANYKSQAALRQLPVVYGSKRVSDNTRSAAFEDSTIIRVNRFDEDSLFYSWFLCHGETVELDASAYGSNVLWSTGSKNAVLEVLHGGLYTLEAGSACEHIFVSHDVTSASCPYTISVSHVFVPDTVFPCSAVICRFVLYNDSGEPRANLAFTDTLPSGFSVSKVLKNPFGGALEPGLPANVVSMQGMNMKPGRDTLDILVTVGDMAPGRYNNQGKLYNLPQIMGPVRWSDNPATPAADSSSLYILGTQSDTLFFDEVVCSEVEITLDARKLGKNFLWDDGSMSPTYVVTSPGLYHLTLFDGCTPSDVFWKVAEGTPIEVAPMPPFFIHQGEQVELAPDIFNLGDTLLIAWTDPVGNSLSCLDCLRPLARPLKSTVYGIEVSNGICMDSASVAVQVDDSRRIYAPNVFSPNDDGVNDYFYLQSPDDGLIHSFSVFDRWGNTVFSSGTSVFNVISDGWDGNSRGKAALPGVYIWRAEIEFIDGTRQVFSGDVTVLR